MEADKTPVKAPASDFRSTLGIPVGEGSLSTSASSPHIDRAFSSSSMSGKLVVGEFHQACCPICLEDFTEGNPAIVYSCNHAFHLQCAEEWHQRHESCPMCLKSALSEGRVMSQSDIKHKHKQKKQVEESPSTTPSSTEHEHVGLLPISEVAAPTAGKCEMQALNNSSMGSNEPSEHSNRSRLSRCIRRIFSCCYC